MVLTSYRAGNAKRAKKTESHDFFCIIPSQQRNIEGAMRMMIC